MYTTYRSWRSAPGPNGMFCDAFEWVEFPHAEVVHTGLTVTYRIGTRVVMIAPVHIGLASTARQPGDVGTLVIPRWLAQQLLIPTGVERGA